MCRVCQKVEKPEYGHPRNRIYGNDTYQLSLLPVKFPIEPAYCASSAILGRTLGCNRFNHLNHINTHIQRVTIESMLQPL